MAQQQGISQPGPFGGLMRYDEEFQSKFMISPAHVIAGVILILALVIVLKVFFPAAENSVVPTSNAIPIGQGLWMALLG